MSDEDIELPPLPKASKMYDIPGYDEEELKDYARTAIQADRARRALLAERDALIHDNAEYVRAANELAAENERLRAELEIERLKLAAIGAVAHGSEQRLDQDSPYRSDAYDTVCRLAEMAHDDLAKDAARYRWLRARWGRVTDTYKGDSGHITWIDVEPDGEGWDTDPDSLDAAIDAAIQRESGRRGCHTPNTKLSCTR